MDTGSEFAYMMAKLGADLFKDSSSLLKEVVLLLYQNKSEREKFLLASGNFEKLALRAKEFSATAMKLDDIELFKKLSKNTKLEFIVMPSSVEGSMEANIIYNKEQDEILNDILLNIQKDKLEKIANGKADNIQETDEISNDSESKGINASLEEIRFEKAKEMADGLMNSGKETGNNIKPKVKEMER